MNRMAESWRRCAAVAVGGCRRMWQSSRSKRRRYLRKSSTNTQQRENRLRPNRPRSSARLLDRLMSGEASPKKPTLLPAQGVVVRESTDFISVDNNLVASALAFIAANYHLAIGADDIAQAVSTHTRTRQRNFRSYLERPIVNEIRNVRIEHAKRDLTQTNHPFSKIAQDVSFGEAKRMCEFFRREVGITPKQYRQERR